MIPDIADRILAHMGAVWPNANMPVPTLRLWHERLVRMDEQVGWAAVAELERTSDFWPSLAQLTEASRRALEKRRAERPALPPASDGAMASAERVAELFARMRVACVEGGAKTEAMARTHRMTDRKKETR